MAKIITIPPKKNISRKKDFKNILFYFFRRIINIRKLNINGMLQSNI